MRRVGWWLRMSTAVVLFAAHTGPGKAAASPAPLPVRRPAPATAVCDGGASLELVLSAIGTAP